MDDSTQAKKPRVRSENYKAYQAAYRAKNREKAAATTAAWRLANPERRAKQIEDGKEAGARAKFRHIYGLNMDQVYALFDKAGDACECCGKPVLRPRTGASRQDVGHVDHNHSTMEIRGILCSHCNTGIGLLQDDPDVLMRAFDYLTTRGHAAETALTRTQHRAQVTTVKAEEGRRQ